jgi:hypothetical protein
MDIRRTFTQQLNFRYVNQPVDLALFESLGGSDGEGVAAPADARVMFEGKGVQVLRLTTGALNGEVEKACIRILRKRYPDAVYLFASAKADDDRTSYHLCNDAGKQLALTTDKQRLFQEKIAFFEVTDDVTGTLDLKERIAKAFETEKLTCKFYSEFQKNRELLLKFLKGIPLEEDRNWYASVLLNRLMFIYFIQKRGFIGGNQDWLRQQLAAHEATGANYFEEFLQPLFFRGFAQPKGARGEHETLFAGVPYLNGGLFQRHVIEERCPGIAVDNPVLRQLLDYFDKYHWYLDDRPLRDEDEINPDVLGFIFEKYVNQKQMGAYYTQEDITGYNCKYTILPFLLDKLARLQGTGQAQGAPLPLAITAANIDRYVYEAVKTEDALPTETAREYAARRKRYAQIQQDAAQGKIATVNDLITYNLDIATYADDVVAQFDEHALALFYFECLQKITVLDPTSGSGAFLFAALNILLPLYLACLRRIREFAARKPRAGCASEHARFSAELARICRHDNERYYTVKSIIVNNLYGVDIMEEATEICKLRLFLRLAAEIRDPAKIEPLPDIDFNVKAGNTLVGFATREDVQQALSTSLHGEAVQQKFLSGDTLAGDAVCAVERKCQRVDQLYQAFHSLQTADGIAASALAQAKQDLRGELKVLNDELNRALAREYGVALPAEKREARTAAGRKGKAPVNTLAENSAYARWLESHQPFHWFAEFYGILSSGGFDVVVGNPPYIELEAVEGYAVRGYTTEPCGNLYAMALERATHLANDDGGVGMIVPVSSISTDGYVTLQRVLLDSTTLHISNFDDRPSKLFDGLEHIRLSIIVLHGPRHKTPRVFTTRYHKWSTVERPALFAGLCFTESTEWIRAGAIPKLHSSIEHRIFERVWHSQSLESRLAGAGASQAYYSRKFGYFVQALDFVPEVRDAHGRLRPPSEFKELTLQSDRQRDICLAALNSSLFYWFVTVLSDCRHINRREVLAFPLQPENVSPPLAEDLQRLSRRLMQDIRANSVVKRVHFAHGDLTIQFIYPGKSKPIIDEIDSVLAQHYGFTDEELDFIINYDIKYRMGQDSQAEAEE